MKRESIVYAAFLFALLLALAGMARADDYPSKPLRMIVPFAPGSTTDTLARLLGARLGASLGQPVVVENRAGAGGNIGTGEAARAKPDGYTLVTVPSSHAINASLYPSLPYDPVKSFSPVSLIGSAPLLIVAHPSLPASSVAELIALAKSRPGALNYASGGGGSPSQLAMELFKSTAGVDIVHVPYKGGSAVLGAVVSGEVQLTPSGLLIAMPLVKAGRLKALAVTGPRRVSAAPAVPTVAESGLPGYSVTGWWGVLAPAGTPQPIVARLNRAVAQATEAADYRAKLAADGIEVAPSTPEGFGDFLRSEIAVWGKVVRDSGARPE